MGTAITIDRDGVVIPVSRDQVAERPRVYFDTKSTTELGNTASQCKPVKQINVEGITFSLAKSMYSKACRICQ